jgi:hypothetical protein
MNIPPHSLKTIVALDTASAAASTLQFVLDGTPVARMGIDLQTRARTVASNADVALAVAGLAGTQIAPRLDGMIAGPDIMAGQHTIGMAIPAVGFRETGVVGSYAGERNIPELPPVRLELQVGALKLAVAGGAVALIMATVAALGAAFGLQGVEFPEIIAMALRHIVALVIVR